MRTSQAKRRAELGPSDSEEEGSPAAAAAADEPPARRLRPRAASVSYLDQHAQLDAVLGDAEEEGGGAAAAGARLDVPMLCRRVESAARAATLAPSPPSAVTPQALAASGLRQPLLIRANACGRGAAGVAATRAALGLRLPGDPAALTLRALADAIGPTHTVGVQCRVRDDSAPPACDAAWGRPAAGPVARRCPPLLERPSSRPGPGLPSTHPWRAQVPTIDVATQGSGPRLTLRELVAYLEAKQAQQAAAGSAGGGGQHAAQRGRLLNVVSLSLAGTALEVRVLSCFLAAPAAGRSSFACRARPGGRTRLRHPPTCLLPPAPPLLPGRHCAARSG